MAWVTLDPTPGGAEVDTSNPFALLQMFSKKPTHRPTGPTIAVLHVEGSIVDGDSQPAGLMGGGSTGSRGSTSGRSGSSGFSGAGFFCEARRRHDGDEGHVLVARNRLHAFRELDVAQMLR